MSHAESDRELRLALVLNGGVSLAVWISGVIHEVDRLRRASHGAPAGGPDDTEAYRTALGGRKARVDVIAGASAGGINGALLAAAIQGGTEAGPRPLRKDGRPLRDVWLELGDLSSLIRPTTESEPPSLLGGDECFLPPLTDALGELLAPRAFRAPALSAHARARSITPSTCTSRPPSSGPRARPPSPRAPTPSRSRTIAWSSGSPRIRPSR